MYCIVYANEILTCPTLSNLYSTLISILIEAWIVLGYLLIKTGVQFLQNVHNFKYKELKVATNDFHPSNKIGEGGFGSVFKVISAYTLIFFTVGVLRKGCLHSEFLLIFKCLELILAKR